MKYFDRKNKQIIHTGNKPVAGFWDDIWKEDLISANNILSVKETLVSKITKRYLLPEDGTILEGGCGTGGNVMSLEKAGFNVIGVDFAENTVKWLNENIPELIIDVGDVRKLTYKDDSFSGYWSLGVIEHFQDGYLGIIQEMFRVLKKGGYLFLSFPYMSLLRRLKAKIGKYKKWRGLEDGSDFYEYFLKSESVVLDLKEIGFQLVDKYSLNSLKGAKDEIAFFRPILQKLHDYKGGNFFVMVAKNLISRILNSFAGHSILLVMRKK